MPLRAIDQGSDSHELDTVTLPLKQCPPATILQELFEYWGDTCEPSGSTEDKLAPGWFALTLAGELRYYSADDMQTMLSELLKTLEGKAHP